MALYFLRLSKETAQEIKSVDLVRGPVVLDPMMAALLRLLSVQSGVTVSVLPTNLVDLNVDLDLIIMLIKTKIM